MIMKIGYIALHSQTPKHFRGGWSHNTDTSEPIVGYNYRARIIWYGREVGGCAWVD
jgi:hypothetical protein